MSATYGLSDREPTPAPPTPSKPGANSADADTAAAGNGGAGKSSTASRGAADKSSGRDKPSKPQGARSGVVRAGSKRPAPIAKSSAVKAPGAKAPETRPAARSGEIQLFARRVRRDQLVYVTCQLAIMIDTGISLSAALTSIASQEENPTLKAVVEDLRQQVEGGSDFSSALARHPKLFDQTYVSLVRASEATGKLAEMLERIAAYQQKELETRGKIRSAMAYPAVMFVLSIGVSVFLLTYIFPKFTPLFARKGKALPLPTRAMMALSDAFLHYWYLWLLGLAALVGLLLAGRMTARGRQIWDWCKINLPVLGTMFRKVIISRSIRTLGTMLASGVPTLESLRLCAEICSNHFYERLWTHVHDKVMEGSAICAALSDTSLLPRTLVQMINAGEETGKLDAVLDRVSQHYDKEVENSVKAATSLIEPLMMCFMALVIGTIALALMLPIFSLTKQS